MQLSISEQYQVLSRTVSEILQVFFCSGLPPSLFSLKFGGCFTRLARPCWGPRSEELQPITRVITSQVAQSGFINDTDEQTDGRTDGQRTVTIISLFWKHKQSENTEKQYEQ